LIGERVFPGDKYYRILLVPGGGVADGIDGSHDSLHVPADISEGVEIEQEIELEDGVRTDIVLDLDGAASVSGASGSLELRPVLRFESREDHPAGQSGGHKDDAPDGSSRHSELDDSSSSKSSTTASAPATSSACTYYCGGATGGAHGGHGADG
jgi:hypothetical protein